MQNRISDRISNHKPVNKKALLGVGVLLAVCAIIGISSFFPFIIDPSQWQTVDFLTKELIIVVIIIVGVVTAMFIGQANNAGNAKSEIAKSRKRFSDNMLLIKDRRSAFKQWVKKVLEPADLESKRARLFAKHGLTQKEVLNLEREEITALIDKPQKYGDVFYHAITKEQCSFILAYKSGKYSIDYVSPEYYLTVANIHNDKTTSEKAGGETKTKTAYLTTKLVSKIVQQLIIAMTLASLIYDTSSAGDAAAQATAWMTFTSRIFALVSATFCGYIVGSQTNDIEAEYINMRCDIQDEFLADKTFVPKDEQELAKEEFIDRVKSENAILLPEMKHD